MTRAGLTPARVVEAAADLADAAGYDALTASAVARAVGVKVASLYSHVGGTDDLRARVSTLALTELADRADKAVAGLAGRDALAALGDTYRSYARSHPGCWTAAGRTHAEAGPEAVAAARRHTELALAVLRGYRLPEAERPHAVRLVGAVFRGFVDLEAAGGFARSDPPADQSWQRALDVLHEGLLRLGA